MKDLTLRLLAVTGLVTALLLSGCDSEKPDPTTAPATKAVVEEPELEVDENEDFSDGNEENVPTEPEDIGDDGEEDSPLLDGEISEDTDDWGELH